MTDLAQAQSRQPVPDIELRSTAEADGVVIVVVAPRGNQPQHHGGFPLLTQECKSIAHLDQEIARIDRRLSALREEAAAKLLS